MSILQMIILIAAISNILLGLLVLTRNPKSKVNISFSIFAFISGLWVITNFVSLLFSNGNIFWSRLTYATGALMIPAPTFFVTIFCFEKSLNRFLIFIISLSWIVGFVLSIFAFTPYIVKDIVDTTEITYGPFFIFLALSLLFSLVLWLSFLIYTFRRSNGLKKPQVFYILLGIAFFGMTGMTCSVILPLFGINTLVNLDSPCSLFFVAFATYAIIKHRLMDIRLIIFRSILYSCLVFLLGIVYVLVVAYLRSPLQEALGISQAPVFILAGFTIAFGFPLLKKLLTKVTDRWLYKGRYNPDVLLNQIGDITDSVLLLEPLLQSLINLLYKELRVEKIGIVTEERKENRDKRKENRDREKERDKSYKGFNNSQLSTLNSQILIKLLDKKDIVVYDELPEESRNKNTLRKQDISLIVPLKIEDKPIGILVLGDKKSGDAWTKEDIKFLILISHQIAIAVKNAQFYSKIVSDKQRIANLLEERKELDKLKEEFQAIATHEINTPIAASEGYLSMVLEGKAGKLTPCLKSFVSQAFQGTQRTHSLIKNLISAAEIEHGKIAINKVDTDIKRLISEVVYDLKLKAEAKNLQLIFIKPKEAIPKINIDPVLIKEALLNLIYNAIKFTKKGQIEVKVSEVSQVSEVTKVKKHKSQLSNLKSYILISVEDTGIGIDKKHLPHIFQKFYQADTSYTREHQGTGLGLYVVKSIIDLHKGKIKVQSKPQVGSRFIVSLPIEK